MAVSSGIPIVLDIWNNMDAAIYNRIVGIIPKKTSLKGR